MWRTGISIHLELASYGWLPEGAEALTLPNNVYEALGVVEVRETTDLHTANVATAITGVLVAMATEIGLTAGQEHPALRPLTELESLWASGQPEQVYHTLHNVGSTYGVDPIVVAGVRCLATIVTGVTNWDGNSPDGTDMWTVTSHMAILMRAHHDLLGEDASQAATARLVDAILMP